MEDFDNWIHSIIPIDFVKTDDIDKLLATVKSLYFEKLEDKIKRGVSIYGEGRPELSAHDDYEKTIGTTSFNQFQS